MYNGSKNNNLDTLASSNLQGVSSDVGCKGAAEQQDRASSLLDLASALQGGVSKHDSRGRGLLLGTHGDTQSNLLSIDNHGLAVLLGASQSGVDIAKGNSVATDAQGTPFFSNGLGQSNDTSLSSGVIGLANVSVEARGGGDLLFHKAGCPDESTDDIIFESLS